MLADSTVGGGVGGAAVAGGGGEGCGAEGDFEYGPDNETRRTRNGFIWFSRIYFFKRFSNAVSKNRLTNYTPIGQLVTASQTIRGTDCGAKHRCQTHVHEGASVGAARVGEWGELDCHSPDLVRFSSIVSEVGEG